MTGPEPDEELTLLGGEVIDDDTDAQPPEPEIVRMEWELLLSTQEAQEERNG